MAIPHLSVKILSRANGQSAIAAASYRSGEAIYNELEKKTHDFTRKQDVLHKEIISPDGLPDWVHDRQTLWNKVEATEKRKDAQPARNINIALPRELSDEQNKELMRGFIHENFVNQGMIADMCIHDARANDGGKNPHAHVLLTMREFNGTGFGKKNREWNDVKLLEKWRDSWEEHANRELAKAGHDSRISMKSYEKQGIDKEATSHLGPEAAHLEEQGIETQIGNQNRKVKQNNAIREIIQGQEEEREQFDSDLDAEVEKPHEEQHNEPPESRFEAKLAEILEAQQKTLHGHSLETLRLSSGDGDSRFANEKKKEQDAALARLEAINTATSGGDDRAGAGTDSSAQAARERHEGVLRGYMQTVFHRSVQANVELYSRIERFVEKTKEVGKSIFDKFTSWTDREQQKEETKERDYER